MSSWGLIKTSAALATDATLNDSTDAVPDGFMVLLTDLGTNGEWFKLDKSDTTTTAVAGSVYVSQGGARWKIVQPDIGRSEIGYGTSAPDPANPDGWSVHYHYDPTYNYTVTRVWDGAAWVVVAATPIVGEWGSGPLVDGAISGHIAFDYNSRTSYAWMNDLGTGFSWVNIGTF